MQKYTRLNGHVEAVELTQHGVNYKSHLIRYTPYPHRLKAEIMRYPTPFAIATAFIGADGLELEFTPALASLSGWVNDGVNLFSITPMSRIGGYTPRKLAIPRENGIVNASILFTAGRYQISGPDEHDVSKLLSDAMVFRDAERLAAGIHQQVPQLMTQPLLWVRVSAESALNDEDGSSY